VYVAFEAASAVDVGAIEQLRNVLVFKAIQSLIQEFSLKARLEE